MKEISIISEIVHKVFAIFRLGHLTYKQVNFRIEFAIAVYINIDFKDSTAERILGILLVHLNGFDRSGNELIFDGNLHDLLILGNGNSIAVFVQNESRGRLDFSDDPSTERYILKVENTNFIGLAGKDCRILGEHSFILIEEAEQCSADREAILIQLLADNTATDHFIFDGIAVIDVLSDGIGGLIFVIKGHLVNTVGKNIVAIGCVFLNIDLCTHGNICSKSDLSVGITSGNFDECILGDSLAVCGSHFFCCEHSKFHTSDFICVANSEDIILFKRLDKIDYYLLTLVIERGRSCGDLYIFSGIGQFYSNRFSIQNHSVRGRNFGCHILAQV